MALYYLRAAGLIIALLHLICGCATIAAQNDSVYGMRRARPLIAGIPVLFYTPETRWGAGASGIAVFSWKKDSVNARPSTITLGFAFTQNRQMFAVLPYHLFFNNGKWQLYGELAYNRYRYNFFGAGNDVPPDYMERYGLEFPRVRVTGLYRWFRYFYAGPRFAFDRFTLFDLAPTGILATNQVQGAAGGFVSGPAAVFMIDARDNIYYPSKGLWTELVFFRNMPALGATGRFTRIAFDFAKYFSFRRKNILAVNIYTIYSPDDLPFYQMGMLGGIKKMRGFYEGRYRDNNVILFQGEYRRWIKGIFGFAVFGSAGQVAHNYLSFDHSYWRFTYGAGIRVRADKVRKVNLRIDVAVGNGKVLPYFTVGEAF